MTFLYLSSDRMGEGDDALGRRLLLLFLDRLAASEVQVDLVGCVNGAVHLTTADGPALESLRRLEAKGARIATCGTCLDHLGLRDELRIGGVGAMDQTVQVMAAADRVLRP
ncbi:MAG: DsrE family protein [Thermoanaerobaculia bacterium]|nr:DsrE family protein [Thermoanaerobaculia bacterium]MCZ7649705.1 DsrE family protein [Thermoanaerobaculia bacterium]